MRPRRLEFFDANLREMPRSTTIARCRDYAMCVNVGGDSPQPVNTNLLPCGCSSKSEAASSSVTRRRLIPPTPTTSLMDSLPSPPKSQLCNFSFNSTPLPSLQVTPTMSSSHPSSYLSTIPSASPLAPPWCFNHFLIPRTSFFGTPLSKAIFPTAIILKLLASTPKCEIPLFCLTDSLSPWLFLRAQS